MAQEVTEKELRQDMMKSKLNPDASSRSKRVYQALRRITDEGSVFYVLADTPDQFEDAFHVLVDDKIIIGFDLVRNDSEALPINVERYSIDEYRAAIADEFTETQFRIALELARRDLGKL